MKPEVKQDIKEWIKDILIAIVIAIIVIQFVKPTLVKESSMEPNFYENNYLFLSKQAYAFKEPRLGDVIVFESELKLDNGDNKLLIKRVIGLPGDVIDIKDEKVYLNGEKLEEDYIKENGTPGNIQGLVVPKGEIFVMGDNRRVSIDSRELGCISQDTIIGRVFFRLYPFKDFGIIHRISK